MYKLVLEETPIIQAILLVLNHDESTPLRKNIYDHALTVVKNNAEKILLEHELEAMAGERNSAEYQLKSKENTLKYKLQDVNATIAFQNSSGL